MPAFTGIQPIRYERKQGWVPCEEHRAQRFVALLHGRRVGNPAGYPTKRKAMEALTANAARHRPLERNYKLGSRMPKQEKRS